MIIAFLGKGWGVLFFCLHVGWFCRWLQNQSWKLRPAGSREQLSEWAASPLRSGAAEMEGEKRKGQTTSLGSSAPSCAFSSISGWSSVIGLASWIATGVRPQKSILFFFQEKWDKWGFSVQVRLMAFRSSVSPLSFLDPAELRSLHCRNSSNQGSASGTQSLNVFFSIYFTTVFPYMPIFVTVNYIYSSMLHVACIINLNKLAKCKKNVIVKKFKVKQGIFLFCTQTF